MIPVLPPPPSVVIVVQATVDWFTNTLTKDTEDGTMTLVLRKEANGTVSGKLSVGGENVTLRGHVEGNTVTGTADFGASTMPFTLTHEGNTVKLLLADEETVFSIPPTGGESRRSAPVPKSADPLPASGHPVPSEWKTYENPTGLTFRYPPTWKMTDANGLLLLVPPGGSTNLQSASEIYAFVGLPVPGIERADDSRLLPLADNMVGQMFPYMHRSGMEAVKVSGKSGVVVTYDGKNPSTGKPSRIRSRAVVYRGLLLQLQSWGDAERTAAHDTVLRQMFFSIAFGTEQHDPRLVGDWSGGSNDDSRIKQDGTGRITSGLSSQSSSGYRLMADGTLLAQTTSRSIATFNSSHSVPESQRIDASVDTGDRTEWKKGRWYAGGGKIVIVMDDGTGMSVHYQIDNTGLVVHFADGTSRRFIRQ